MWDRKRQLIWIAGGLIIGTYIAVSDSFDGDTFVWSFFFFMETLVILIMAGLFYFYSRRS